MAAGVVITAEELTQNGRYFTLQMIITGAVASDDVLMFAISDLDQTVHGKTFSKFKIMTLDVTAATAVLSAGAACILSWASDNTLGEIPFFVLPKWGSATFDFRKLPTHGLVNTGIAGTLDTGALGDIIAQPSANLAATDAWNLYIEGYLVP